MLIKLIFLWLKAVLYRRLLQTVCKLNKTNETYFNLYSEPHTNIYERLKSARIPVSGANESCRTIITTNNRSKS